MAACIEIFAFFLTFLSIAITSRAEWNTKDYQKREHSLVKPYQGSGMSVPLWDFQGSTMVTNSYVRLTSDHQSLQGAIWNTMPCYVRNWELHVQFKVHGQGKNLFGDGIAIWYTREKNIMGPVFGSKDNFVGLGIFLDTYSNHNGPHNHQHPYISAMVNNGSMKYDHDTDGTLTQLSGCSAQFRNKDHETYVAIRYEDNSIKVSTDIEGKSGWTECFSVNGIKLPVGYYFGASATTGELADNHDIISIKLYELETPDSQKDADFYTGLPVADNAEPYRDRIEEKRGSGMSGWKLFAVIIIFILGLGVCAIVGFLIFLKKQEDSRKRFY